jgi:hypothetical protein
MFHRSAIHFLRMNISPNGHFTEGHFVEDMKYFSFPFLFYKTNELFTHYKLLLFILFNYSKGKLILCNNFIVDRTHKFSETFSLIKELC